MAGSAAVLNISEKSSGLSVLGAYYYCVPDCMTDWLDLAAHCSLFHPPAVFPVLLGAELFE